MSISFRALYTGRRLGRAPCLRDSIHLRHAAGMAAHAELQRVRPRIRAHHAEHTGPTSLRQPRRSQRRQAGEVAEVRCEKPRVYGFHRCWSGGQRGPAARSLRRVYRERKTSCAVGHNRSPTSCTDAGILTIVALATIYLSWFVPQTRPSHSTRRSSSSSFHWAPRSRMSTASTRQWSSGYLVFSTRSNP